MPTRTSRYRIRTRSSQYFWRRIWSCLLQYRQFDDVFYVVISRIQCPYSSVMGQKVRHIRESPQTIHFFFNDVVWHRHWSTCHFCVDAWISSNYNEQWTNLYTSMKLSQYYTSELTCVCAISNVETNTFKNISALKTFCNPVTKKL